MLTPAIMLEILGAGAYTASYASVNFNGFAPLRTYCVDGLKKMAINESEVIQTH